MYIDVVIVYMSLTLSQLDVQYNISPLTHTQQIPFSHDQPTPTLCVLAREANYKTTKWLNCLNWWPVSGDGSYSNAMTSVMDRQCDVKLPLLAEQNHQEWYRVWWRHCDVMFYLVNYLFHQEKCPPSTQITATGCGDFRFGSKLGQIGTKCDKISGF